MHWQQDSLCLSKLRCWAVVQAEMTTNQGAVYVTDNAAQTWKAAVQETVDATLNRTVSSGEFPRLRCWLGHRNGSWPAVGLMCCRAAVIVVWLVMREWGACS